MPSLVPNRSSKGCLTCKRRKKKCDEKRPQCERCFLGGFDCLGYASLIGGSPSPSTSNDGLADNRVPQLDTAFPLYLEDTTSQSLVGIDQPSEDSFLPLANCMGTQMLYDGLSLHLLNKYSSSIPESPQLGPLERENMLDLIVSQYVRMADRTRFRPFPFSFKDVIASRARSSNIILKTMYLGARIVKALSDDTNWHNYVNWIESFHYQISGFWQPGSEEDVIHLADRLSAHQDLASFALMLLNSIIGYSLLRKGVPLFLQLAARTPQVWTQDSSAISISHALKPKNYAMAKFILIDTISALAFGTAPLINYDTTIHEDELEHGIYGFLERVYSCPIILLIMLARINSARIARLTGQSIPNSGDVQELESQVRSWSPTLDYTEKPSESITRFAVQECWRQATLIYGYMGMCGVNSADERVQPLVSQVAQLAGMVEAGSPVEAHLFVPSLIAGLVARKEKHRAVFRRKMLVSQNIGALLLRGADFVFVLDHLWHGAAVGGSPVTWDHYVNSRYATMPMDT